MKICLIIVATLFLFATWFSYFGRYTTNTACRRFYKSDHWARNTIIVEKRPHDKSPRAPLRTKIVLVSLTISQGCSIIGIGVTTVANMRTRVVLADALGHDEAVGFALALILAVIAYLTTIEYIE